MFSIRIHAIEASVDNNEVNKTLNEFGDILGVTFDIHECDRTNSVMGEAVVDKQTYDEIIDSGKYRQFVDRLDDLDGSPISFYVLLVIRDTETNIIVDNVLW
jgi:hypothetical protein